MFLISFHISFVVGLSDIIHTKQQLTFLKEFVLNLKTVRESLSFWLNKFSVHY